VGALTEFANTSINTAGDVWCAGFQDPDHPWRSSSPTPKQSSPDRGIHRRTRDGRHAAVVTSLLPESADQIVGNSALTGHAVAVPYGSLTQTGLAVVVLAAITLAAMSAAGIRQRLDFAGAAVRAVLQLLVVALIVAWVFQHPQGAALYLAVMLLAATATSIRRIRCGWSSFWRVIAPLAVGAAVAVIPVFLTGALPLQTQTLLPFAAQMIGGSMTAVSLAGVRFRDDTITHWNIVEGYLALGATPRQAVSDIGRNAAQKALIPGLDQTRSVGLVVLPGAFVGMLLGGATPAEAAQVQLLVLIALIAATTCAAASLAWTLAPRFGAVWPQEPVDAASQ